jgi:hypothetical protein
MSFYGHEMLPQLPHLDLGFPKNKSSAVSEGSFMDPSEKWLMEQLGTHGFFLRVLTPLGANQNIHH